MAQINYGEINRNIAGNIKRLRRARGWSVARLAEECEAAGYPLLTASSLGNIERGLDPTPAKRKSRDVTAEELFMFADLFGTAIDVLVGRAPCPVCGDEPPQGFTCNNCGAKHGDAQPGTDST